MTRPGSLPERTSRRDLNTLLAAAAVRYRVLVLSAAALLTLACVRPVVALITLHVQTNIFSLLPDAHPTVRAVQALVEKMGGRGDLAVLIESPDPGANETFAGRLQAAIADLPWITASEYRLDTAFLEQNALLLIAPADLDEIERRLRDRYEYEVARRDPGYVDLLEEGPPPLDFDDIEGRYRRTDLLRRTLASADGRALVLAIYPAGVSGEVRQARHYADVLRARVAAVDRSDLPADLRVSVGGTFADRVEEYDSILADLRLSAAIMGGLFVGLVLAYFRQAIAVPLVFLTFAPPLLWTFALARAAVEELNLITVFLVNVLSGLGIDFAIHTVTRYLEERARGRSVTASLAIVHATTTRSCGSAAATTAAAFFVLIGTRFLGFRQFGLIAGFGLVFAFLSSILVLPSLLAVADHRGWLRPRPPRLLPCPFSPRHRGRVLLAAGLLALAGLAAAPAIRFEYDLSQLRTRLSPSSSALREAIEGILGATRDPIIVVARDLAETASIQAALRARAAGADPEIRSVVSVLDLVPPDQDRRLAALARLRDLVDAMAPLATGSDAERLARFRARLVDRPVTLDDLPDNLRRRFFGAPGTEGNLVYAFHAVPPTDARRAARLVEEVRAAEAAGTGWRASCDVIVVGDLLQVMQQDSLRAVVLSSLAVATLLFVGFRSLGRTCLALAPLVVGVLWMLAGIRLAGWKLNFYNMVVFPSILGIGVDSGIHIYRRFLEHPFRNVSNALRATHGAVAMSALTTMISFGSLAVSVHRGLASLGVFAVLGLTCILVAAVVVFPLLLERQRPAPSCRQDHQHENEDPPGSKE